MRARPLILPLVLALSALAARPAAAQPQPESPESPPAPTPPAAAISSEASTSRPVRTGNPLQRIPRITTELVLGTASAAGMAYSGYQLGCALQGASHIPSCGDLGLYGLVSGFALGIPIGVMLGGSILDGDGGILATLFGTGFGIATVVGGLMFFEANAAEVNPIPLVAIPLVFAVVGYELSSHHSRAAAQAEARGKRLSLQIAPSAAITRQGAALGVLFVLP